MGSGEDLMLHVWLLVDMARQLKVHQRLQRHDPVFSHLAQASTVGMDRQAEQLRPLSGMARGKGDFDHSLRGRERQALVPQGYLALTPRGAALAQTRTRCA